MYSEVHYYHLYNSGGARITPATRQLRQGKLDPYRRLNARATCRRSPSVHDIMETRHNFDTEQHTGHNK